MVAPSHLPALLVAAPVVAAVVPPAVEPVRERVGWTVAVVALVVQATLAVALARAVVAGGPVRSVVGGFPATVGIELVADGVSVAFALLVALVALATLAYTRAAGPRSNGFYALYLLAVAGFTGVCLTGDAFNLFVFLEISGIASYAMVARAPGPAAAVAALKYLLAGTVGATLYLLGVGYAYAATGTLNLAALAAHLPRASPLTLAAFALVAVGLAVKAALFPVHGWQPDAYDAAPVGVSALLSALGSTVAAYALVRFTYAAFTVAFLRAVPAAPVLLSAVAAASVVAGALLALRQARVRRILAYSSVSQFGLVVLGVGLVDSVALTGAVVHLLGHAVTKGGLFLAAGVVAATTGAETVEEYAGAAREAPVACGAFAVLALGMVGLPPTVGFAGKWYLALGAVREGAWAVAALVLASTLLSLAYFGRVVQRMYVEPGDGQHHGGPADRPATGPVDGRPDALPGVTPTDRVSVGMRAVVVGAALATVALGLGAAALASLFEPAVEALLTP